MTLEEYQKLLDHHDWYYDFSDDLSVWRRGEASSAETIELAKTGPDDFKRAYNEAHARNFKVGYFVIGHYEPPFPEVVNGGAQ